MHFPFKSLSARFTAAGLVLASLLISLTLYSQHIVSNSANQSLKTIRNNQILGEKLNSVTNTLEDMQTLLHQYSADPHMKLHDKILASLARFNHRAKTLQRSADMMANSTLDTPSLELTQQAQALTEIIKHYLRVMQNVESRYPGMPILLNYLEPSNKRFSEAVEEALQTEQLPETNPAFVPQNDFRIMQLFEKARYAWAMQISWFRMFVANRMGAFGNPRESMAFSLKNRNMFTLQVKNILYKLDLMGEHNLLGLQQQESLKQMHASFRFYLRYSRRAIKIYSSPYWSEDVRFQREFLNPAIQQFWKTLHRMGTAISGLNKKSIAKSQATANQLSRFIWLFAGLAMMILIAAYRIFQEKIRKPLLMLTKTMHAAETSSPVLQHSDANLHEISLLTKAYNEMRQQVDNRQRRLQSILDNAAESIIIIDNNGDIEDFNKAASNMFQYQANEINGKPFAILFPDGVMPVDFSHAKNNEQNHHLPKNASNGWELTGKRKDNSQFHILLKFSEMRMGGQALYTAIVEDISERRAVIEHLRNLAEHDSLTGLYNRQFFNDEMERTIARALRNHENQCACIYIDLDNFKYINDTMGHVEGDRLLVGIANTLKSRTRKMDVLARLGGDEFALLLHNVDKRQVSTIAEEYRMAIASHSFITRGKRIDAGCSIGVALFEPDISSKEDLLARADIACHVAKRSGRNRVYIFEHTDKNRIDSFSKEMGWARRIRHALEHDEFIFATQPMLDLKENRIFSKELLLRMNDTETDQYLLPGGFLDSAERFGLMPEIDRWVIRHGFNFINWQHKQSDKQANYFINLSGKSIGDPELISYIKTLVPSLNVSTNDIVFEITEDVAIANLDDARECLYELQQMGFSTALDDFGVGYSSFSYLRDLDVDYVKIDGSFINAMQTDELNFALVKAMNDICHILGKKTVAEFVQNEHALKLLRDIGVDYAQGNNIAAATEEKYTPQQIRSA